MNNLAKLNQKSICSLIVFFLCSNFLVSMTFPDKNSNQEENMKIQNIENLYSEEKSVLSSFLDDFSDSERMNFINQNSDEKSLCLSRLATISSNYALEEILNGVQSALNSGLSGTEIKEAVYHSAPYCGYTRAAETLLIIEEVLQISGNSEEYSSRITSEEKNRYEDGLFIQRYLFGNQIGTILPQMSESQKLITKFLSGICFGDFYNRTGLSLLTREFITFCTIAGNGNCISQLKAHAMANLNCGKTLDSLRAAILYNQKINGKEKTLEALKAINEIQEFQVQNKIEEPKRNLKSIPQKYRSDSEELLAIMNHFKTDDSENYINKNLLQNEQEIILLAVQDFIQGSEIQKNSDEKIQNLVNLAILGAQGGKDDEISELYKKNIQEGISKDQMLAVALLCTPYNGFPRTLNFTACLNNQ